MPLGQFGTEFTPDEHMSYFRRADGSSLVYWAGGILAGPGETVAMTTADFSSFTPLVLRNGNAVSVFSPSGPGTSNFDADYAGPGTVLRAANGSDLLMIYHAENHLFNGIDYPTAPFYAALGLARSTDGGATWTRQGEIITGMTPKPAGTPPRGALGAANPCVVAANGYLYVFYVDIGYQTGPDVVHLARAPINSDGAPGAWQKWYDGSFGQPGLGGLSTPVQGQVPPGSTTLSAGNPDVSFNGHLQQWVMVFQTADGFYYSTSVDLTSWTVQGRILAFGANNDARQPGQTWYGYPTLISPDQPTEQGTSASGYLYYAKGVYQVTDHTMYRRAFSFSPAPAGPRLANISARAQVGSGASILIAGFVVAGAGTEALLIRADGPSLAQFGVSGALAQPSMSVFDGTGKVVASNTGWSAGFNPAQVASAAAAVGAFALPPGSADCALVAGLPAGAYSVQVSGQGSAAGIALAEVYELPSNGTRLVNISTRAQVGPAADTVIVGFVVSGGAEPLLARGDGPSLVQFNVAGFLPQPSLSVFDSSGTVIGTNTGWSSGGSPGRIADAASSVGAFALPAGSADSALIVSLPAGSYTVQLCGANNTTGVGLAELYELP